MIPDSIKRRLTEVKPMPKRDDRPVEPGDIRRAENGGEERLVLVLGVNPDRGIAQITLVHPYSEYATDSDIVVDQSVSDVTFPLVVQAGMRGVVLIAHLGSLITVLPAEVVGACLSPRPIALSGPGLSNGTSLCGPLDARAEFKEHERHILSVISTYDID